MDRKTAEAFVLRTRPLGEADLIVTLLTAEDGRVSAVARSAKKSRRRFGAALEPMTRVRASWTESERRDLAGLESCDILHSYVDAQRTLPSFYVFAYVAEVAEMFSRESQSDTKFFRLVGSVLDAAAGGAPLKAVRRYFDIWTLRLQGLLPELERCADCGGVPRAGCAIDLARGQLLCGNCAGGESGGAVAGGDWVRLSDTAIHGAQKALRKPPAEVPELAEPGSEGLDALARRAMLRFTERPLKSIRFLQEAGV